MATYFTPCLAQQSESKRDATIISAFRGAPHYALVDSMHKTDHSRAHGRICFIRHKRIDSRRVVLPPGF